MSLADGKQIAQDLAAALARLALLPEFAALPPNLQSAHAIIIGSKWLEGRMGTAPAPDSEEI